MVDDDPAQALTQAGGTPDPTNDTLVATRPSQGPRTPLGVQLPPSGYQVHELIGKGGMGEVMAATDERIGREVAIKRMRASQPDAEHLARFLREARIQARLDHPAIVPVHELGTDPAGRPYFVMKRITGRTMAQHMTDGAQQQTLLRKLAEVSLAIDLAHTRGVVHRDLKPANIMLGDYGEVYVLDWGVARVLSEGVEKAVPIQADIDTLGDGTQTGTMLGTPGYMAPEIVKGEPAQTSADIYALGSILFEILASEPLHPRGMPAIANTLTQAQQRPSRRTERPVAPELDNLCFAALAEKPTDRPTARQFADRLQRYLDGDRDVARRRELAQEQLDRAREALAADPGEGRKEAIARAGRAMALAPEWAEATELVADLVVRAPEHLPKELTEALKAEELVATKQRSRTAYIGLQALFISWLVMPFLGIKSWPWMIALYASLAVHTFYTWRAWRTGAVSILVGFCTSTIFLVCATRLAGIWIITPIIMCGSLLAFTSAAVFVRKKWLLTVWTILTFAIPILLEWIHLMPSSWEVQLERVVSISTIFRMEGWVADAALIASNVVLVIVVGHVATGLHHANRRARRLLSIQNWHMNQLIPNGRRSWATQPGGSAAISAA